MIYITAEYVEIISQVCENRVDTAFNAKYLNKNVSDLNKNLLVYEFEATSSEQNK